MGFLRRLWGYITTLFRRTAEGAMNPEIEIEQAINEARKRDQELRNQAAKVVAHRTQIESKMEKAAGRYDDAIAHMAESAELAGDVETRLWRRMYWAWYNELQDGPTGLEAYREVQREIAEAGIPEDHNMVAKVQKHIADAERRVQ